VLNKLGFGRLLFLLWLVLSSGLSEYYKAIILTKSELAGHLSKGLTRLCYWTVNTKMFRLILLRLRNDINNITTCHENTLNLESHFKW